MARPTGAADRLAATIEPWGWRVRSVTVARRGCKGAVATVECDFLEPTDPEASRVVARRIVELALADAGQRERRYTATVFDGRRNVLATVSLEIGPDTQRRCDVCRREID